MSKRFTDAELVAEYWYELGGHEPGDDWERRAKEWLGQLDPITFILERFATRPHAHETNYE